MCSDILTGLCMWGTDNILLSASVSSTMMAIKDCLRTSGASTGGVYYLVQCLLFTFWLIIFDLGSFSDFFPDFQLLKIMFFVCKVSCNNIFCRCCHVTLQSYFRARFLEEEKKKINLLSWVLPCVIRNFFKVEKKNSLTSVKWKHFILCFAYKNMWVFTWIR